MKKLTIKNITLCALFTALIAVGAFIKIPVPMLPFTLQTMFTVLAGLLLGSKVGGASALCYMLLGLMGLPIFTQGGGPMYIFQPSFGYIIGFVFAAYTTGRIAHSVGAPSLPRLIIASLAGMFVIYLFGVLYYWLISALHLKNSVSARSLLVYCFLVFVPGDATSCIVASVISKRLIPVIKNRSISA